MGPLILTLPALPWSSFFHHSQHYNPQCQLVSDAKGSGDVIPSVLGSSRPVWRLADSFGINFLVGRISTSSIFSCPYLDWGSFAETLLFFLWQTDTFIIIITHKCCYVSHQQIITACCSDWQQNNLHRFLIWMKRWRVKLFCVSNVLNRKDISKRTHTWSERNKKENCLYVRSSLYSLFYFSYISYCYLKMPFGIKIQIFHFFPPQTGLTLNLMTSLIH